jgi:50S ribosomal protein L16 3-hydroxylase
MKILNELVGQQNLHSFLSRNLFRLPYAAPFNGKKFQGLIDWSLLNEIFLTKHANCWLVKNGKLSDDTQLTPGVLTEEQALHGYQSGKTVLIRHAEKAHSKVLAVADEFRNAFHSPIDIQIYVTPGGNEGFDWHYDIEDVFVIQSRGEKEFRLIPNTVTPRPLPFLTKTNCRFEYENKKTEIRCWLKPGDFLYIPAGYWHKAKALTDSFHLSVGVMVSSYQM